MLKKLALSIALIWGAAVAQNSTTALEPGVVYSTGNLVNNTTAPTATTGVWQNIGSWNQGLPCWAPGDPGCGPLPYFNNGSLNYSYGTADVRQTVNINAALSSIGSGLRVNGYNFGFTAKNGNGWDDGRVDYLTAYVRFVDPNNVSVFDKSYNLNYKFNWTTFNFSETFVTPFASKDLGAVTYGIVGRDNNGWAGPYGPEVQGINFSLKYSVDPCATNPLYSPTCPGYLDALAKLIPASTATVDPVSSSSTSAATTTTIVVDPVAATVNTTSTSTAAQSNAPAATTSNKESTPANNSLAMSIIGKNAERDKDSLGAAQTAMATASQAALASQQEAAAVAAGAVANSIAVSAVNVGSQQFSGTGLRANATNNLAMATTSAVMGPGSISVSMLQPPTQTPLATASSVVVAVEPAPAPAMPPMNNNSAAQATPQSYAVLPPNFLTDRTNPLTEIVEGRQNIPATTAPVIAGPVVNTNAGDNDAAGGVSINRMALAPTGYGDYLNFALRDAAFYAPKEVYRNQRTVDNARALRQLSSDVRHREMVEQQYRR